MPDKTYRTNLADYQARIHFYSKEKPVGPVTLEIRNDKGMVIRTFSSTSLDESSNIKIKKGLNTITWNLRHEGPELVDNLVAMVISNPAPGPKAVPGNYTVRLSTKKKSQTQPLIIQPDPRWSDVSKADYQAQLELALQVSTMITESQQRIQNLRAVREQLRETARLAVEAGHPQNLSDLAKRISDKLTTVEDQIIQNKAEASQDNINYPRVFSNHIGRLYSVLVDDDERPTGGVLERFEDLKTEYRGIVQQYDAVIRNELPKFNDMLDKNKVSRIILPNQIAKP